VDREPETCFPSLTCCFLSVRKSVIHLQVESGTLTPFRLLIPRLQCTQLELQTCLLNAHRPTLRLVSSFISKKKQHYFPKCFYSFNVKHSPFFLPPGKTNSEQLQSDHDDNSSYVADHMCATHYF